MPTWTTACPDWEARVVDGRPLIPFQPLFPKQAQRAIEVFGELRMVDATGSPLMREAVRPWANEFVAAVFGSYDDEAGRRLVNEFLLLVSKKNGKSSIAAGIMLTALVLNWRPSGEYIILSPTKEIADNSYKPIRDMIAADEELSDLFHVQTHIRTVTHRTTQATLKVVAADSDTVSGKKAIGVFVDELHEFGKQAKAANMLLEATGGLASRPEGFVIYATTQSEDPPAGVFKQKLEYARKVRDGLVKDSSFLPVLYEFPKAMIDAGMHRNLENAYVTNPNWKISVDEDFITKKHQQAQEGGEEEFRLFLAKHLNVEIGLNLRSDRWAGAEFWEAAGIEPVALEWILENCEVATIGVDGGGLDDLLGLCVLGREHDSGRWVAWCRAWAHPSVLERRKSEAARFRDFAKDGDLILVEEIGEDVTQVVEIVRKVADSGILDKIGADQHGIGSILDELVGDENNPGPVEMERIVGISQGWRLQGAIKTAERRLASKTLVHGSSPLMAWCVGNARIVPAGNAISITKQASGTAKIDPLMALFNAVQLMALNPVAVGKSFWETA